tara:strand:+ start:43 stop:525 length:483 start_codon:yes stop_codon:yes gene_type:complete
MAIKRLKDFLKFASGFSSKDSVRKFAATNPIPTAGLLGTGGYFVGKDIVAPIAGGLGEATGVPDLLRRSESDEKYEDFIRDQDISLSKKMENQRIEQMVQQNMAMVAKMNPQLYNQVMAGRVLPKGAVVLGGPRREDLMEELAYLMGSSSSPEQFESLLS